MMKNLFLSCAFVLGASSLPATAVGVTVIFSQQGVDVRAEYSGSLDLTGWTQTDVANITPSSGAAQPDAGIFEYLPMGNYDRYVLPMSNIFVANPFGTGGPVSANGFGAMSDAFGFLTSTFDNEDRIIVPDGYDGDPAGGLGTLSGSLVFTNKSVFDFGLNPSGTIYTLANGSTITVQGPSPVPLPASLGYLAAGLGAIALRRLKNAD